MRRAASLVCLLAGGLGLAVMHAQSDKPVEATARIAEGPRTVTIQPGYGKKFSTENTRPQITITNPFMDPARPLFAEKAKLQCNSDGSLVVTGRAGFDADGRTQWTGTWRVAPDGAVTPLQTRSTNAPSEPTQPRAVEDGEGNRYVTDEKRCELRRISATGETTMVLGADVVCGEAGAPEDRPVLDTLAWDPAHKELVSGGSFTVARPVHDLYTVVWRIAPDGKYRRVLFAKKASRVSPAKHHLDGVNALAVDPKGRIFIVSLLMVFEQRGWDALQLMRVDEAAATVVPVSGTRIPNGTWLAEFPMDGPVERAWFNYTHDMCITPDGTTFVSDDAFIRKIDLKGQVSTWVF